ncbi:hypothetical protein BH11PSE2_BH11PSE2_22120 [soil metagenome]
MRTIGLLAAAVVWLAAGAANAQPQRYLGAWTTTHSCGGELVTISQTGQTLTATFNVDGHPHSGVMDFDGDQAIVDFLEDGVRLAFGFFQNRYGGIDMKFVFAGDRNPTIHAAGETLSTTGDTARLSWCGDPPPAPPPLAVRARPLIAADLIGRFGDMNELGGPPLMALSKACPGYKNDPRFKDHLGVPTPLVPSNGTSPEVAGNYAIIRYASGDVIYYTRYGPGEWNEGSPVTNINVRNADVIDFTINGGAFSFTRKLPIKSTVTADGFRVVPDTSKLLEPQFFLFELTAPGPRAPRMTAWVTRCL